MRFDACDAVIFEAKIKGTCKFDKATRTQKMHWQHQAVTLAEPCMQRIDLVPPGCQRHSS
jgi:hypothetical protein